MDLRILRDFLKSVPDQWEHWRGRHGGHKEKINIWFNDQFVVDHDIRRRTSVHP